jgi:predicted nuclease of predicted toxin-antitoxin system
MARTIRFHLDENCDPRIAAGLALHGVDVTTPPAAGLLHASDEAQLAYAVAQGRVIVTQDADFLRMAAAGRETPGVVFYPDQGVPSVRSSATSSSSGRYTNRKRCEIASNSSESRMS